MTWTKKKVHEAMRRVKEDSWERQGQRSAIDEFAQRLSKAAAYDGTYESAKKLLTARGINVIE